MYKLFLTACLFLLVQTSHAQAPEGIDKWEGDFPLIGKVKLQGIADSLEKKAQDAFRAFEEKDSLALGRTLLFVTNESRNQGLMEQNRLAVESCVSLLGPNAISHPEVWASALSEYAIHFGISGNFPEALTNFRSVRDWYQSQCGADFHALEKNYNDLAFTFQQTGEKDSAYYYYERCLEMMDKNHSEARFKARTLANLGLLILQEGDYEEAKNRFLESEELLLAEGDSLNYVLVLPYNGLAWSYMDGGDSRQSVRYYLKVQEILKTHYDEDFWELGINYNNLGSILNDEGIPEEAEKYFLLARDNLMLNFGADHTEVGVTEANLGSIFLQSGKWEEAQKSYERARDIYLKWTPTHPRLAKFYAELSVIHKEKGELEKAWSLSRQSEEIFNAQYGPQHPDYLMVRYDQGDLLKAQEDTLEAIALYRSLLRNIEESKPDSFPFTTRIFRGLAYTFLEQGKLDSAMRNFQLALDKATSKNLLVSYENWNIPKRPQSVLQALVGKVRVARRAVGSSYAHLANMDSVQLWVEQGFSIVDSLRIHFRNEDIQLGMLRNAIPLVEEGVRTYMEAYERTGEETYIRLAFQLSQRKNGLLLQEAVREMDLMDRIPLSTHLLQEVDSLKKALYLLQSRDSTGLEEKKEYLHIREELEQLYVKLREESPEYYALRYASAQLSVDQLQAALDEDECMISYLIADDHLYQFRIWKEGISGSHTKLPASFEEDIRFIQKALQVETLSRSYQLELDAFVSRSHKLYELLLGGQSIPKSAKKLIILPDGPLSFIPFDLLLENEQAGSFATAPYLLRNYSISYAYHMGLWTSGKKGAFSWERDFAGFASDYSEADSTGEKDGNREELTRLSFARSEVNEIASLMGGESYAEASATESLFKKYAGGSQIIHLASHALVSPDNPMNSRFLFGQDTLSGEDGVLHAWELYPMKLSAEMAVLSACHSGFGTYEEGEGVMSLARAFQYAGCQSVIMSLWQAQDEISARLMHSFYEQLQKGLTKDEALRQAKLTYLEGADPLMSHPFFWAGFIASGDMEPLQTSPSFWIGGLVVLGIVLVGIGILFFRRFLPSSTPNLVN